MIERDFDLGRAHPLVRRNKALRQQIALRIINEEYHVTVPVVLSDILGERVQRLRDVPGSGEDS